MLTFEKVLKVFGDYLSADNCCEVVSTSHGYAVLDWDDSLNEFDGVVSCLTPEDLRDALLGRYEEYQEFLITDGYERELTDEDKSEVKKKRRAIQARCRTAARKEE